ncbi:hypothetical protein TCELL_0646 [Thermogladius calderae 1633]|uniref:QueT transporter family protein n=1 Tax=Thermogladius calderae (strain DSM 22663 / VKM B-2946 / 1633) TaxID=1184251 RepID=I3TE82_THEC1|nr:QueT transporter family protein [Thermogladius calderae]AFK51070.1 hypothetical protein TCELL_0646 [Thermogladius calderae 1633]
MEREYLVKSVKVAKAMAIAGVYTALTVVLGYWSFGPLQFRVADAMLVLPYLTSMGFESVAGLTIGGFLGNIPSPFGLWDWLFGPATNLGASLVFYTVKRVAGRGAVPFILGGLLSAAWIAFAVGYLELVAIFGLPTWTFLSVLASELVILEVFGGLLVKFAQRIGL